MANIADRLDCILELEAVVVAWGTVAAVEVYCFRLAVALTGIQFRS